MSLADEINAVIAMLPADRLASRYVTAETPGRLLLWDDQRHRWDLGNAVIKKGEKVLLKAVELLVYETETAILMKVAGELRPPPSATPDAETPGSELRSLMDKVTVSELDNIVSQLSFEFPAGESPVFWRDKPKAHNMEYLLRWARRHPQHAEVLRKRLVDLAQEKAQYPTRGPVAGTRYIRWGDFTALPSYPMIASAVSYPHDYRRKSSPVTKDEYVSVDAIYNMSAWASWKSSSLDAQDRAVADAIHDLGLLELMRLNKGRRADQPALFPERMLPT